MAKRKYFQLIIGLFLCLSALSLHGCAELNELNTGGYWDQRGATANSDKQAQDTYTPPGLMQRNSFENLPAVKVAILLPLSGPQANVGQSMLQAAQLALFDIGYNNFQLIPRDTNGTVTGAQKAANDAVQDGAQIILGPLFANSVRAVKSIAQPRGINVIAFSTDQSLADNSTFIMGFMPSNQVDRVTRYATQNGYKNFAVVSTNDEYGNMVTDRFNTQAKANGAMVTSTVRFNPSDTNVLNDLAKLNGQNFQAVFMPVMGGDAQMISNSLTTNNLAPARVKRIGTGLWDDTEIAKQASMQGAWFAAPSPLKRAQFENKYRSTYGQAPVRIATLAYDATALTATLAKNGFETTGQPAFNNVAITNPNGFNGTDGIFRFNSNGIIERALAVLELRDGQIVEIDPAADRF